MAIIELVLSTKPFAKSVMHIVTSRQAAGRGLSLHPILEGARDDLRGLNNLPEEPGLIQPEPHQAPQAPQAPQAAVRPAQALPPPRPPLGSAVHCGGR